MATGAESSSARIEAVRQFNRFYTRRVGALNEALLDSPFSLTEARVLYEVHRRQGVTATQLGRDLGLDAGYLSRILQRFENRGLLTRATLPSDGRQSVITLTEAGRAEFAPLDSATRAEIGAMLAKLSEPRQRRLVSAMRAVEDLLAPAAGSRSPYSIRHHRPGDLGFVVHRQAALYLEEYGWDGTFEALLAEIVAKFIRNFDPEHERCWIAEIDDEIVGSVLLTKHSATVAQLRMLYVDPAARGLGIGSRLVEECIRFARDVGYEAVTLWTNDILVSARRIYEAAGFRLVREEKHRSFGHDLVGQYWDLPLDSCSARPGSG